MTTNGRIPGGQTLLIDADDTLWENNIYFERAIAAFISFLDHQQHTREQVRATLNEVERQNVLEHGYGLKSFRRALVTCYERLSPVPLTPEGHRRIDTFADSIAGQEIELLPGVAETLPVLAARHRLILMTKGNEVEQIDKLARSGLAGQFAAVEVVREKHPDSYAEVCERRSLIRAETWMIGNSPKSDINPAIAAGLHAVFIRHPNTWILEHEAINSAPAAQHLLQVEGFAGLREWF